jgi:hypothetical protein
MRPSNAAVDSSQSYDSTQPEVLSHKSESKGPLESAALCV